MLIVLVWFLLLLLIVISAISIIFGVTQFYFNLSNDKIGFVPTLSGTLNKRLAEVFTKYLKDPSKYTFVELGSGVANISSYVSSQFNFKEVIAVEIDPLILTFGKFLNLFYKSKVKFVRRNIFNYEIPKKSVLYCYLTTSILERLLKENRFQGHLVISTTFKLKNVTPVEVIEMRNFYRRMYVYDFREQKRPHEIKKAGLI